MTLQEMASLINKALRYKAHQDEIILALDAVQKLTFSENMRAFKEYTTNMTIYQEIEFLAAGYTNAVAGDVGKAVVGGTSSTSGTLISYDNTTRKWVVNLAATDDYTVSEAITITSGTGAGTLVAADHQVGYKGPYSYPTSPAVRKMHGVTIWTDAHIFGTEITYSNELNDYGLPISKIHRRRFFQPGRHDDVNETFTFSSKPNRTDTYRWFYWYKPDTITTINAGAGGDDEVLIPSRHHAAYVQACVAWIRAYIKGEPFTKKHAIAFFEDWMDDLLAEYTPMGKQSNRTSKGSYMGDFFTV